MVWGIKVSKSGEDVKTADDEDLIYSSEYNTPKIHKEGSFTVGTDPSLGTGADSVSHGLDYTPAYLAFVEIEPGDNTWFLLDKRDFSASKASTEAVVYTNDTNIVGQISGGQTSTNYTIYYFIFLEEGQ